MRILITVDPMIPVPPVLYGGIERVIALLVGELSGRGHEVALLAHPDSKQSDCRLFSWPAPDANGSLDWRFVSRLHQTVAAFRPDVVHSFSRLAWTLSLLRFRKLPLIMSYQRQISLSNVRWASRIAGPRLHFTACSKRLMSTVPDPQRWHAIPNPADGKTLQPRFDTPSTAPLVFLSRLDRVKAPHLAIAAAIAANKELVIAGNRADSGPERDYFEREVAPHLAHPGIRWVGPVNDQQKRDLLSNASAMIVPIQWEEPFGIVFAEALACGTPVIASPRGALPEIVIHGTHGFLVEGVTQLTDAISRIQSLDRNACRRRFDDLFSVAAVVNQYEQLYHALAQEAAPNARQ